MKRLLKYIILVLISWFAVHELLIIADGLNDEEQRSRFAVIFGTKVNEDGTLSERLQARLDKGIELYYKEQVQFVVVSGGLGKEGHYEGSKMAEYLISAGLPDEVVFIDNNGTNTRMTVENFINEHPEAKSVSVVSQFYHINRAKLAFRQAGIEEVYGPHADYFAYRDFYACIREFPAYYKYLIF